MNPSIFSAFVGSRLLSQGPLDQVWADTRSFSDNLTGPLLVFDHTTGGQTDLDWRQSPTEARVKAGPGRPKLGVVSTEVTLLPRHWEWLNAQPARASGTLRRLVEEAMAREASEPKRRLEALGRILWVMAGNEVDFEEASRALYAGDRVGLEAFTSRWPGDLPAFVRNWS